MDSCREPLHPYADERPCAYEPYFGRCGRTVYPDWSWFASESNETVLRLHARRQDLLAFASFRCRLRRGNLEPSGDHPYHCRACKDTSVVHGQSCLVSASFYPSVSRCSARASFRNGSPSCLCTYGSGWCYLWTGIRHPLVGMLPISERHVTGND